MNSIEDRLKTLRKNSKLSQRKFAEQLGIAFRTVQRYEIDASMMSVKTASNIASFFNVDLDWLLTGRNKNDIKSENVNADNGFINQENANRLIKKLIRLEYISESQLDRVEKEIDKLLEIAEDVAHDIKKAEEANWQKDKEQKKEAIMATMVKTQRRKKAAG
jgi:transcriptional regulator with XRE-family HTH domain